MLHRFVALFVAVLVFCSGLLLPDSALSVGANQAAAHDLQRCSADVLDQDQPADWSEGAHADKLQDVSALVDTLQTRPDSPMTMVRPRRWASAGHLPPFLEGPQRPPCETPVSLG